MNERIEELAEKAASETSKEVAWIYNQKEWHILFTQKFAELIVKECSNICLTDNVSNLDLDLIRKSGKFTVQDLATRSCGENLSVTIKKHFGVE